MEWVVNATPRPLYPRKRDLVIIVEDAGYAPGTDMQNPAPTGTSFQCPIKQLHASELVS
jgi:hypothetical protein